MFKFYASIKIQNITTRSELFHTAKIVSQQWMYSLDLICSYFFSDMYKIGIYMRHNVSLSHIFSLFLPLILISPISLILFSTPYFSPASGISRMKNLKQKQRKWPNYLQRELLYSVFNRIFFNNFPSSWTIKFDKVKNVKRKLENC